MIDHLTDDDRYPNLSPHGHDMLRFLREHPSAPRYTAQSGHRLTPDRLERVRAFDAELRAGPHGWSHGELPPWLHDFVAMCYRDVPFYRAHGAQPSSFFDIPTCDRADLSREPWNFVPDSQPLDGLMVHSTSGTTGHPVTIISHPVAGASYLPLLRVALAAYGITHTAARGRVAYLLVGWQRKSFTYPSVVPEMDDAGTAKLNLHPDDWHDPDDRAKFLDACDPEFYTGDPLAFAELAKLPLRTRPKALVSTAMMLLPGLRRQLEERFGCPVIDLYAMNEAGPVAFEQGGRYKLLQPRLYVEILGARGGDAKGGDTNGRDAKGDDTEGGDAGGVVCPPGVRGEVVLTGGLNPFLPLLRYRTNDFASLSFQGSQPVLVGLDGRPPTIFRTTTGEVINNLDVTAVLKPFALPQFSLHQSADGALTLRLRAVPADSAPARESELAEVRAALLALFGPSQRLSIELSASTNAATTDKVMQYTSAVT